MFWGKTKPAGRTVRVLSQPDSGNRPQFPALQSSPAASAVMRSSSPSLPSSHPHPPWTPFSSHLLHVVLRPLDHQINVRESEAALEIQQALWKQGDFSITRFHLHRIQRKLHQLVQTLHVGEGEKQRSLDAGLFPWYYTVLRPTFEVVKHMLRVLITICPTLSHFQLFSFLLWSPSAALLLGKKQENQAGIRKSQRQHPSTQAPKQGLQSL